jgi:hypothetical protein
MIFLFTISTIFLFKAFGGSSTYHILLSKSPEDLSTWAENPVRAMRVLNSHWARTSIPKSILRH